MIIKKELYRKIGIIISLFLYLIYAILMMVRTKILIINYGSEVNAVFQTANQIFTYFTLIESGMGMAYQFRLYKSVNQKNIEEIAALFMGLRQSMKKVAFKMLVLLVCVAIIYPFIINRVSLSIIDTGGILFLLGLRLVIPYFTCIASKVLLNIYDYKYLTDVVESIAAIIFIFMELLLIIFFHPSIYSILLIGCVGNIIIGVIYTFLIWKYCGEVKGKKVIPDVEPESMTRDIFILKIAGLLNGSIDMIILSVTNIMLVTPYHAYNTVTGYIATIVNKIDENYRTKIGLMIEKNDPALYDYFQIFISYHMIVAIVSVTLFALNINAFVMLWLGEEFELNGTCIILLSIYLIHITTRDILYLLREGAGLYKESKWFSLQEGITNLFLSIFLVRYWGIEGVLFATVFSTFVMFIPRTAKLVYRVMGKKNTLWIDHFIIGFIALCLVLICNKVFGTVNYTSWIEFMIRIFQESIVCIVVSILVVLLFKWKYLKKILIKKGETWL